MSPWPLIIALLLLVANGFFVGAEFALTAARRTKLVQLDAAGNRRAKSAMKSIRELSLMLAGAQLGITMMSFGLGYLAEPAVAALIERALLGIVDLPDTILHTVSFVVALSIVVFLHMVVGEMAPKNIAIAEPERSALAIALPFRAFVNVFRPFIYLMNATANATLRLLRVEPVDELNPSHSAQEIGAMIAESAREGMLETFEHKLLTGAITFGDLDAAAVMVPRTELTVIPSSATPEEIEKLVLETGHSRFPVFGESLDQILGFLHSKDLLKVPPEGRTKPLPPRYFRQMLIVPESRKLHPLLFDMRRQHLHFALVIDEHGGTAGVVTIEDLVEELVGEIRDEHDDAESEVERVAEGRFLAPGSLRVHEAADAIGLELPEGDYETIAGFLMDRLQRIPKSRDEVVHDGWTIRVTSTHRRRVVQVQIEEGPRTGHDQRTRRASSLR
ncbi:MAG: hemolysin family protein [Actinomycetota bacterium]